MHEIFGGKVVTFFDGYKMEKVKKKKPKNFKSVSGI